MGNGLKAIPIKTIEGQVLKNLFNFYGKNVFSFNKNLYYKI